MVTQHSEQEVPVNVPVFIMFHISDVKISSTYQHVNLVLLDDHGRVRNQIISVVSGIQRFDFDCNLVVTRKVMMGILPAYPLKAL